jgi:hypothetical protein
VHVPGLVAEQVWQFCGLGVWQAAHVNVVVVNTYPGEVHVASQRLAPLLWQPDVHCESHNPHFLVEVNPYPGDAGEVVTFVQVINDPVFLSQ